MTFDINWMQKINELAPNLDPTPLNMYIDSLVGPEVEPNGNYGFIPGLSPPLPAQPPYRSAEDISLADKVLAAAKTGDRSSNREDKKKKDDKKDLAPFTVNQVAQLASMIPKPTPPHYAPPVAPQGGGRQVTVGQYAAPPRPGVPMSLAQILGRR